MASRTRSRSTGCPPQTTDAAEPTAKPTSTQCSCTTTSNPSHPSTRPWESTWAADLEANLSTSARPRESTQTADLEADLPTAVHPQERTWAADFAANLSAAVCPPESTLATNFGPESNLETTFGSIVVAGCNVTPCRDAIAIPPP